MSPRRIILLCGATCFTLWLISLIGYGGLLIWCMCGAVASSAMAWVVLRIRRRRHWSIYGPDLRYAMSVLSSRDRWSDLAEILNLSVDADLRRSRITKAAFAMGLTREERRAVRYIPRIAGMREAPYGMAVTVLGAPGQSWAVWQRHRGQLSSALRVREVTVAEPRPGIFELALRVRDPLAAPILLATPQVARGWEIPLGVDERGAAVSGSCRNVSGVVVGGVPGGGKSAWLAFALGSLAHRDDVQWLLIDGKQGYDLEGLAARAYRYVSGDEAGDLEAVRDSLQDIQTLMRERLRNAPALYGHPNLWSVGPSRLHPVVVVVIDECQAYLDSRSHSTKEEKAIGAEIDSLIRDLVKRGRSAGIVVVLSTQRPTADSIPTSTRDNCAFRVCFSVRTREAATSVLGEFSTDSEISPVGAPTGVGVSSVEEVQVRFRSPFVTDDVLRAHITAVRGLVANPLELLADALMELGERNAASRGDADSQHIECSDTSRHAGA
jgi:hypothetical protein